LDLLIVIIIIIIIIIIISSSSSSVGDKNRKTINKKYERKHKKTKPESSFLFSLFSNIYIEHYEKSAPDTQCKLTIWFRFVDDTFVVMSHDPEELQ
jgi:hypothetical protein